MNTADYTPDAICRSLGLSLFAEKFVRGAPPLQLRVLLCPSFHPEVCITLSEIGKELHASVVTSPLHIWSLAAPRQVPVFLAKVALGMDRFGAMETAFRAALAEKPRWVVIADGMQVHVALRGYHAMLTLEGESVVAGALSAFIASLIGELFGAIGDIGCKNALARAGGHVGLNLPVEAVPMAEVETRLLLLGTAEDRAEVLKALTVLPGHSVS